jgi:hypothetical protein
MANIFMLIKAKQIISILCLETIQHKRDGRLSEDIFLLILGFFVLGWKIQLDSLAKKKGQKSYQHTVLINKLEKCST